MQYTCTPSHTVLSIPPCSLVLKAVQNPMYEKYLAEALASAQGKSSIPARPYSGVVDVLAVNLGCDLLKIVPGRVSTEVDAHLSFDTKATVDKALRLVDLYSKKGIDKSRVYIKIASTWVCARSPACVSNSPGVCAS